MTAQVGFKSQQQLDEWMVSQSRKRWPFRCEGKLYWWHEPTISGADIRAHTRAGASVYQLFQNAEPWWEAIAIGYATAVDLRISPPREFYFVPPATM